MAPDDWRWCTIAELGHDSAGVVQTGPFGAQLHSNDYVAEGVPFVLIKNMTDAGVDITGMPQISVEDAIRLNKYSLNAGDIVFSRVGRVGSCFLATPDHEGWIISGQLLRIRLPTGAIHAPYLVYALRSDSAQDFIDGSAVGSTRKSINTKILSSLRVPLPPLAEQRKIAAILSSIDDAIEKTQAVIDHVQVVKRGLMQELLTRGLPGRHTRFKQTEIGEIPESWKVLNLFELSEDGIRNGVFKKKSEFGSGVRLINVFDVYQNLQVVPSTLRRVNVTDREIDKFSAKSGDLFFVRSSLKKEGIGKCCVVTEVSEPLVFECHIMRVRVRRSEADPLFFAYQCDSRAFRRRLMATAKTVTMTTIGQTTLGSLPVAFPPFEEQRRISEALSELDRRRVLENGSIARLKRLKFALTSVLLTGELRVTPDVDAA